MNIKIMTVSYGVNEVAKKQMKRTNFAKIK